MVKQPQGFTYIGVLFVVAMMSTGLALIGEVWHTSNAREKEAELLHIGNEYRKAIERYYLASKDQKVRTYPKNLSDLIKDPRDAGTLRHLRRLYPDPITGKDEWGLVKSPDGGFAGVYSLSEEPPLKAAGFAVRDASFEGKSKYSEWQFVYAPAATPAATPGATPKPGATPGSQPQAPGSLQPPAMQPVFPTPPQSSSSSSPRP
jgi:type II secretory pathway pseudopilin PulG